MARLKTINREWKDFLRWNFLVYKNGFQTRESFEKNKRIYWQAKAAQVYHTYKERE